MDPVEIEHVHPRIQVDDAAVRALVQRVAAGESVVITYLGIILTGHEAVRSLNVEYLGRDYLTDVLAFSLGDNAPDADPLEIDGEVYVDLDTAEERAPEFGASTELEALRYIAHGLLHLAGYDDDTPEGKDEMHRLEDLYLGFS